MKLACCNLKFTAVFLITTFFLSACTGIIEKVPKRSLVSAASKELSDIPELLSALQHNNDALKTFKGIGEIKIWKKGRSQTARLAWIGSEPGKLRFEVLNVMGQPEVSLASDCQWFYLIRHNPFQFYKKKLTETSLKKILSISVRSDDIFSFLAGRVPVRDYTSALITRNPADSGYILTLKKRRGILEKIYLDENKTKVKEIQMFDAGNSLAYRVIFEKTQHINEYTVPSKLLISDDDVVLQLNINRYWADVPATPSMFLLTPPNE